jgi:hypothetical protein
MHFEWDPKKAASTYDTWIYYSGANYKEVTNTKKNVQAIYAGLLVAVISGKSVEVHGNDECVAINIHISNQPNYDRLRQ